MNIVRVMKRKTIQGNLRQWNKLSSHDQTASVNRQEIRGYIQKSKGLR